MARRYSIGDNVFIPKLNDSGKIIEIKKVYVTVLTYYKYVVKLKIMEISWLVNMR